MIIPGECTKLTSDRILDGTDANRTEFPYQVHLDTINCGGSIINALVILTAAHCLKYSTASSRPQVVAGDLDKSKWENTEQRRTVESFIIHENYNSSTKDNDIALLILSEPLQFNNYVRAIDYPRDPQEFSGCARVAGWGVQSNGAQAMILQKAEVPIVPREVCKDSYSRTNITITGNMMCAGEGGKDSCGGDSGGPLTCRTGNASDTSRVLCGIVSFGKSCGLAEYPGVYVDVSKYSTWINQTMSNLMGKCMYDQFRCVSDGLCISRSWKCDGEYDCDDNSDEKGCNKTANPTIPKLTCETDEFRCVSDGRCVPIYWKCDGDFDCDDDSDERGCRIAVNATSSIPSCERGQFQCVSDGRCISLFLKCDSEADCSDGSDETECKLTTTLPTFRSICKRGEFQCSNGERCIKNAFKCDSEADCSDGSDEADCPNTTTTSRYKLNSWRTSNG